MNKNFLRKLVNYIEFSNAGMEKLSEACKAYSSAYRQSVQARDIEKKAYQRKIKDVLESFLDNGVMDKQAANEFYNEVYDSPERFAELSFNLMKTASLGESSGHESTDNLDPIARFAMGDF